MSHLCSMGSIIRHKIQCGMQHSLMLRSFRLSFFSYFKSLCLSVSHYHSHYHSHNHSLLVLWFLATLTGAELPDMFPFCYLYLNYSILFPYSLCPLGPKSKPNTLRLQNSKSVNTPGIPNNGVYIQTQVQNPSRMLGNGIPRCYYHPPSSYLDDLRHTVYVLVNFQR